MRSPHQSFERYQQPMSVEEAAFPLTTRLGVPCPAKSHPQLLVATRIQIAKELEICGS